MERHTLYEINLENKTAFCTICGYTEVHVAKTRTSSKPRVICISRANQRKRDNRIKQHLLAREQSSQPDQSLHHFLSEINPEKLTAICAICGPTDIQKVKSRGYIRYDCLTKRRNYMREYKRSHYVSRPTNPHALSQIDEENLTAVCAKCGPVKIEKLVGPKKITRRCINAKQDFKYAQAKSKRNGPR